MKAWSHLPNADHIDWVLKSLKEDTTLWATADRTMLDPTRRTRLDPTRTTALHSAWGETYDAVINKTCKDMLRDSEKDAARKASQGVIGALVVWDDCDQFLNMPYEKLKVWVALSEDPRAVLLLPMIYVKEHLNEQCMVTSA